MRARCLIPLALLALLAHPRPADAAVALGLGGDWIQGNHGEFNLTINLDKYLAHYFSVGGRAGAAFFEHDDRIGIPVDLKLGLHIQSVYFEGLVGPWMQFDSDDLFHFHVAFGFGFESRNLAGGLEVGRLDHAAMVGLRFALKL
jgi:hypothetical protein